MWLGNHVHLSQHFPTYHELGYSGKVTDFPVKNTPEVLGNGELASGQVCSWFHIWDSRANSRILSDSWKVPQGNEILMCLRLSKSIRLVSPVLGSLGSFPKPWVPFLFSFKLSTAPSGHQQRPEQLSNSIYKYSITRHQKEIKTLQENKTPGW